MKFVPATKQTIREAARIIKKGGLVAFPTETVYGLGANALNPKACVRIFEVKNRPHFDPLIIHIGDKQWLGKLCKSTNKKARLLMKYFWPGPLTLILKKSDLVPEIVTSGLSTVAIRMPSHPVILELLKESKVPIAAPSANPFGYLSPTTAMHVKKQIGNKIDMILDGGKCPIGVESTILDLTSSKPRILRPGGLPVNEIEKIIGNVTQIKKSSKKAKSPGQLESHYSPRTPIVLLTKNKLPVKTIGKIGYLAFQFEPKGKTFSKIEILSKKGDLKEAAANFFSCLHHLDNAKLDIIYAEPVPKTGLGMAIMDRLSKASRNK